MPRPTGPVPSSWLVAFPFVLLLCLVGPSCQKKDKSDDAKKMIPVVVLTSSREERDLAETYKLGVNAYVVKPVDFHDFVDAARNMGLFWAVINEPPPGSARS